MKKTKHLFTLLCAVVLSFGLFSCSDDDKDISITADQLPATAASFIRDYYSPDDVLSVYKDTDDGTTEYEVILKNGHKVTFNDKGEWTDVDAPQGQSVPTKFVPEPILNYVSTNFPGIGINEISKERYGYDVELVNGLDLTFGLDGAFLGYEDNPNDYPSTSAQIPQAGKDFLATYYPGIAVASATMEVEHGVTEYEVVLSNGHQVTFNAQGEWTDVDAPTGDTIPGEIVPAAIMTYVIDHYNGVGINEISVETYGYDVELLNGLDLRFSSTGAFLGVDR